MFAHRVFSAGSIGVALLAGAAFIGRPVAAADKVTVCHAPPGENAHRITIDQNALNDHLAHGDILIGSSFGFYSGASSPASFGAGGEGPITTGLGAIGSNDPITKVFGAPSVPDGSPAVIIPMHPAWAPGNIPGTQWLSYANTSGVGGPANGPPGGAIVHFDVTFQIPNFPKCDLMPSLTIRASGDDQVTVTLNGGAPLLVHGFNTPVTPVVTSTGINPGANTLRFSVQQDPRFPFTPFGLDYAVQVTLN
jgi:hypothetical protein